MVDLFQHPWMSGLFGDQEISVIWSSDAHLRHMIAFEAAWSRHGHLAGLWSFEEGKKAAEAISTAKLDIAGLNSGTAKDGLCVPALVRQLKEVSGSTAVHTGSTSQDVIDTATILSVLATLDLIHKRLQNLKELLVGLIEKYGDHILTGRTRMQAAEPITVRDRLTNWQLAIEAHIERVRNLHPQLAIVQIGGAVGNRRLLGQDHARFCEAVASELGLQATEPAWHVRRETLGEFASLLSLISGTLGKIGQDTILMAQQGIDEISLSGSGGSSAMPHKRNPILAELLVTLARYNATQVSGFHHTLVHEQERSGAAWALEWMILPPMAFTTARGLAATAQLLQAFETIGSKPS